MYPTDPMYIMSQMVLSIPEISDITKPTIKKISVSNVL